MHTQNTSNSAEFENYTVTPEVAERWKAVLAEVVTPPLGDKGERWEHRKYAPRINGKPVPRRIVAVAQRLWETINADLGVSTPYEEHLSAEHIAAYVKVFARSDAGKMSVKMLTVKLGEYITLMSSDLKCRVANRIDAMVERRVIQKPVGDAVKSFAAEHPQAPNALMDRLTDALRTRARGCLSESWCADRAYLTEGVLLHLVGSPEKRSRPYPELVGWNPQPVLDEYAAVMPEPACTDAERESWEAHATAQLERFVSEHERELWVECRGYCGDHYREQRQERRKSAFVELCDGLKAHVNRTDMVTNVQIESSPWHSPRIEWWLTRAHDTTLTGQWTETVAKVVVKPTRTSWACEGCSDAYEDD